ncbi:helix-turn-helix domain-containing protein [Streptomyces sp. A0642]|uniref:helix-turn-helix domain-containing protein n=1 Tax=Streptomyces sp. A0642 TaxID=2563100 RepID=UPI0010A233B0|nr:helix-turn-helix domain-containing protein [Streptomyces sp. A0642]THA62175.1 helix-turn-helix domain-containing protein [Streptomyces sp. A0642]
MATQQVISPSRAPSGGVIHVKTRHVSHFVVIGNHLAQHDDLSLVAIGLATHIQSLPPGAKAGIKCLVERFPESEARIAGALRELERHGYLHRTRERLPDGRVVTRTTSYNHPRTVADTAPDTAPTAADEREERVSPEPVRVPGPAHLTPHPAMPEAGAVPAAAEVAVAAPAPVPAPPPAPAPAPPRVPVPGPVSVKVPAPRPETPAPELDRAASVLLLDLARRAPEWELSEGDVRALTPAVAAWIERKAAPAAIRRALTTDLPVPLRYPVKFLEHRLTTRIPPPPTGRSPLHDPLQNCDGCDRAFRAPEPGECAECRGEFAAGA